jgi:hypothetical protein
LFTGERPVGVGSLKSNWIELGIGRKNRYNDDKGVHDGVPEEETVNIGFNIGVFS